MENQNPNQSNETERKHVHAPLVEGKVSEKSKVKKAIGMFLAEDAENIKDHLVEDYIAPRAKSFMLDLIRKSKEFLLDNIVDIARTMIFGESKKPSGSNEYKSGYYEGDKVYYSSYYNSGDSYNGMPYKYSSVYTSSAEQQPASKLIPLTTETYGDAERVKSELIAISKRFKVVPVADYYQMFRDKNGKPLVRITKEHYNFGWKGEFSEGDIDIRRDSENKGYAFVLPKLVPLD